MRVVIFAYGSRGDVQPFVSLARRLRELGHDPVVAAPAAYAWLAELHGLAYVPLDDRINDFFLTNPDVIAAQVLENPPIRLLVRTWRGLRRELDRCLPVLLDQMRTAVADGADLVVQVYDETPVEQGHHVAEAAGVPWVLATLSPNTVPSRHYPAKLLAPDRAHTQVVNRLSHGLRVGMRSIGTMTVRRFRRDTLGIPNRWRQNNRMRAPDGSPVPVLNCFSADVVPIAPDWPAHVHTTGFLFDAVADDHDDEVAVPAQLAAFIAAGEPPICVGFGSVRGLDPHHAGRVVVDAVAEAGMRAVVVRAGGSIEIVDCPPDILVVEEIAYSWLFRHVCLVVHGGNTGISGEAMRAGVPQVTCPPVGEALAWSRLLAAAGVAPNPILLRDLDAQGLATAIRAAVSDPRIRRRVEWLAERQATEDGMTAAVGALEKIANDLGVATAISGSRPAGAS
jgi:sterol 3beta-glucosyltransferase